jgi:hypothetical protein
LTPEFVDGIELFLDELAKIRNAIDEIAKPQTFIFGGIEFCR